MSATQKSAELERWQLECSDLVKAVWIAGYRTGEKDVEDAFPGTAEQSFEAGDRYRDPVCTLRALIFKIPTQ